VREDIDALLRMAGTRGRRGPIWADLRGADPADRLRWAALYASLAVTTPTCVGGAVTEAGLIEAGVARGFTAPPLAGMGHVCVRACQWAASVVRTDIGPYTLFTHLSWSTTSEHDRTLLSQRDLSSHHLDRLVSRPPEVAGSNPAPGSSCQPTRQTLGCSFTM
jgi:hypothetical protein